MTEIEKNVPKITEDMAGKVLANVFDACGQEPNTIPLSKLASYSEYRREKYSFQKVLLIIVLVVFALLPLCFIAPKFDIVRVSADSAKTPTYEIRVGGFLPIHLVSASFPDENVYVYEKDDRVFSVNPQRNGRLTIRVTLLNRQYDMKAIDVETVDLNPPSLTGEEKVGDELHLMLSDEGLGIDFSSIYAETVSGSVKVLPVSFNPETGLVVFKFPKESMNIYVPDNKGNILQLLLTVSK